MFHVPTIHSKYRNILFLPHFFRAHKGFITFLHQIVGFEFFEKEEAEQKLAKKDRTN